MRCSKGKFEIFFGELLRFEEKYGHIAVPARYISDTGYRLGDKVHHIRTGNRKLTEDEIQRLNDIKFVWRLRGSFSIDDIIKMLEEFKAEYKHLLVPQRYKTPDGVSLGSIVAELRSGHRAINEEDREKLDAIKFIWKVRNSKMPFEELYERLKEFKEKYKHCLVPQTYVTDDGIKLGIAVGNVRSGRRKLTPEQIDKLNSLGFVWNTKKWKDAEQVVKMFEGYL